jgi:glycosyltransferase involved in cell wall biosynthesis
MKILIASDTYYPDVNGASYFAQRLAAGLAKRGHQISVMAPARILKDNISARDSVIIYGIGSIRIPIYPDFRVSPLFLIRKAVEKHIKEIQPDIIHIQNHFVIGREVALAAKKFNICTIGTNHFMPDNLVHYLHLPDFGEKKLNEFSWHEFSQVYKRLDAVTTVTKTAANLIEKLGLEKDVIPISCGIDLEKFNPRNDGTYLKERYGIPESRSVILYVGRLDREKRIELIMHALPQIIGSVDAHLALAGTGKLRAEFEHVAEEMGIRGRVTFTGFVPDQDLPNLYRMADLFVIAGIAELQSIVTMEAMASGLPVIAVNAVALPELVHDGENGYLFPDGDSQTLAERAITILSSPALRAKMGQKSLDIIQAHDIQVTLDKYESLYRQIIAKHICSSELRTGK